MRLPNTAHTSRPWRIHELAPDFAVEDVWALATPGGPHELPRLVSQIFSGNTVMHLSWIADDAGGYHGQMAVLVKPNGLLGAAYLAAIKPFRYLFVYPALMRSIERGWLAHAGGR